MWLAGCLAGTMDREQPLSLGCTDGGRRGWTSAVQGLSWPVGSELVPSEALDRHEAGLDSALARGPVGSASCPAPGPPPCSRPHLLSCSSCGSEPLTGLRVTCLSQGPSPSLPLPDPGSSGSFCPSDPSDTHSDARRAPELLPGMGSPSLLSGLETNSNLESRQ